MTFKNAVDSTQCCQLRHGENSGFRKRGIKQRRRMSFREYEAIVRGIVRIRRIKLHFPEKDHRSKICCRHTRCGMPRTRCCRCSDGMNSETASDFLKCRNGCGHDLKVFPLKESGEGGIRTHGGVSPTPVFETGLFNRAPAPLRTGKPANDPLFYGTPPRVAQ